MRADEIDYEIFGDDMQGVSITLDPGETVRAEPGAMMWMEQGVEMSTSTGGGLMKGIKRMIGGESLFITSFTNEGGRAATVGFSGDVPGKIIPVDLGVQGEVLCQRDAYLCSAHGVEVTVAFTKRIGAGLFGGEGFILQRLRGDGLAFINAGGHVLERQLAPGEQLRVDTGCVVGFQASVDYDIQMAKGIKTMLFGGEGLFFASLTGPGKVWIQTMPFSRLADRVLSASKGSKGEHRRFGDVIGTFLGGD